MNRNYGVKIPESGPPVDLADIESVSVRVRDAAAFFASTTVKMDRWIVSETFSNAYVLSKNGQKLDDDNTALQKIDNAAFRIIDGALDIGFAMPPSSVSFVVLSVS